MAKGLLQVDVYQVRTAGQETGSHGSHRRAWVTAGSLVAVMKLWSPYVWFAVLQRVGKYGTCSVRCPSKMARRKTQCIEPAGCALE